MFHRIVMHATQGKLVGDILHYALDKVMNGEIENQQDVLINEAKKYLTTRGE